MLQEMEKIRKPGDLKGPTCYCVEIDVTVTEGCFTISTESKDIYTHEGRCCSRLSVHILLTFLLNMQNLGNVTGYKL